MVNATKYGVFYSSFTQFKIYSFEFDQLLTNSFPLDYFHIYLQRFILSGKIVVEMQFFCKINQLITFVTEVFYNEQYLSFYLGKVYRT